MSRINLSHHTQNYSPSLKEVPGTVPSALLVFFKDPNEHMSETSGSSTGQKSAHFYISHKRVFIKSQSYNCSFPKLVQVPSPTLALYYYKIFSGFWEGFFLLGITVLILFYLNSP